MKRPYRHNAVRQCTSLCCTLLGLALISFAACSDSGVVQDAKLPIGDVRQPALTNTTTDAAGPGPQQQHLQALIGEWKAKRRTWARPDAPAEEGKGTISNFWMLDGGFLGQEYKSRSQRPKYHGLGALGYDNVKKMYTSVWLDTTSTSIYTATGSCDPSGKVFTLKGVYQDPATGKPVNRRSITRIIDEHNYTFEVFEESSDGKAFKAMEITCTR